MFYSIIFIENLFFFILIIPKLWPDPPHFATDLNSYPFFHSFIKIKITILNINNNKIKLKKTNHYGTIQTIEIYPKERIRNIHRQGDTQFLEKLPKNIGKYDCYGKQSKKPWQNIMRQRNS